jgi:hypothetical protein
MSCQSLSVFVTNFLVCATDYEGAHSWGLRVGRVKFLGERHVQVHVARVVQPQVRLHHPSVLRVAQLHRLRLLLEDDTRVVRETALNLSVDFNQFLLVVRAQRLQHLLARRYVEVLRAILTRGHA